MTKSQKKKMFINMIVACDKCGGIGLNGGLPWATHFEHDIDNFKTLTTGHGVLMGRKTWESLPGKHRPLKNRRNYIVSSTLTLEEALQYDKTAFVYKTVDDAINGARMDGVRELWVIGGSTMYKDILNRMSSILNHVWITKVDHIYETDTFFPIECFKYPDFTMVYKTKSGLKYEISRFS